MISRWDNISVFGLILLPMVKAASRNTENVTDIIWYVVVVEKPQRSFLEIGTDVAKYHSGARIKTNVAVVGDVAAHNLIFDLGPSGQIG
jgi:hypothetical protein